LPCRLRAEVALALDARDRPAGFGLDRGNHLSDQIAAAGFPIVGTDVTGEGTFTPKINRRRGYRHPASLIRNRLDDTRKSETSSVCRLKFSAVRRTSVTGMPPAPCFKINAFSASENFEAFIVPRSSQPGNWREKLCQNDPVWRSPITVACENVFNYTNAAWPVFSGFN